MSTLEDLIESISRGRGLVDGLLELDRDEIAVVLAHIANEASKYSYLYLQKG